MIEEFIIFAFELALWYLAFSIAVNCLVHYLQQRQALHDDITALVESIVHEIIEEHHGTMTYWYDRSNGTFYGQGQNIDEIRSVLKQRYPTHVFVVGETVLVGPEFEPIIFPPDAADLPE